MQDPTQGKWATILGKPILLAAKNKKTLADLQKQIYTHNPKGLANFFKGKQ